MTRARMAAVAAMVLFLSGCPHDVYEIQLTPKGPDVERKLTAWHTGGDKNEDRRLSDERLAELAPLYEKRLSDPDDVLQTFVGTFRDRMPSDVGGAGFYAHYASEMGTSGAYTERFRGDDNQAAVIEDMMAYVDRMVGHLIGWFDSELAGQEGWPALRTFFDTSLRTDLKNMALLFWMVRPMQLGAADSHPETGLAMRALQYLAERGYVEPETVPEFMRMFDQSFGSENSPEKLLRYTQRFAATKMGVPKDKPIPQGLGFLDNAEKADASLRAYLASTSDYAELVRKWREEKAKAAAEAAEKNEPAAEGAEPEAPAPEGQPGAAAEAPAQQSPNPEAGKPDALDVLKPPELSFTFVHFGDSDDEVRVTLGLDREPWTTNGTWDAEAACVRWESSVEKSGREMPIVWYALWTDPDEEFQKQHLGAVALDGDRLFQYCLWRESLTEPEAAEWTAFFASLEPGPEAEGRLNAFRFTHEPKPPAPEEEPGEEKEGKKEEAEKVPSSYAAHAVSLILGGLRAQEESAAPEEPAPSAKGPAPAPATPDKAPEPPTP